MPRLPHFELLILHFSPSRSLLFVCPLVSGATGYTILVQFHVLEAWIHHCTNCRPIVLCCVSCISPLWSNYTHKVTKHCFVSPALTERRRLGYMAYMPVLVFSDYPKDFHGGANKNNRFDVSSMNHSWRDHDGASIVSSVCSSSV